jgi:hypothetical protein
MRWINLFILLLFFACYLPQIALIPQIIFPAHLVSTHSGSQLSVVCCCMAEMQPQSLRNRNFYIRYSVFRFSVQRSIFNQCSWPFSDRGTCTGHPFPRRRDNTERITFISPRGEIVEARSAIQREGCSVIPPTF